MYAYRRITSSNMFQEHWSRCGVSRLPYGWHDWASLPRAADLQAYFYGLRPATDTAFFKKIGGIKVLPSIKESDDEVIYPEAVDYKLLFTPQTRGTEHDLPRPYGWATWASLERAQDIKAFFFGSKGVSWTGLLKKPELCGGFYKSKIVPSPVCEPRDDNENNSNALVELRPGDIEHSVLKTKEPDSIPKAIASCGLNMTKLESAPPKTSPIASMTDQSPHSPPPASSCQKVNELRSRNLLPKSLREVQLDLISYRNITFTKNVLQKHVLLGEGAYGKVYLGQLSGRQGHVVIKVISRNNMTKKDIFNEAKIQKLLEHKCIVPKVLGISSLKYSISIIQEFINDPITLDRAPLAREDWVKVLLKAAQAIKTMHELQVLHNDLKADNILVQKNNNEWRVLIIDFGLATFREGQEFPNLEPDDLDKYTHLAPELFFGFKSSRESDIYSFGKVMEMSAIKDNLDHVIQRCLIKEFYDRPNIEDIIECLKECEFLFEYVTF